MAEQWRRTDVVEKLLQAARASLTSPLRAAYQEGLDRFGLRPSDVVKIRLFCDMMVKASQQATEMDAYKMADALAKESGYLALYKNDNSIEGQARAGNVEELLNSVALFCEQRREEIRTDWMAEREVEEIPDDELPVITLGEFLESTALLSNADVDDEEAENKIALMTVHTAKGLEFPYVFIAGMEENLFPSGGSLLTEREMEEERRLFYVALTRAKKSASVSFAVSRMRNGRHESNAPSRFLKDVESRYYDSPSLFLSRLGAQEGPEEEPEPTPRFGGTFHFGSYRRHSWKDEEKPAGRSAFPPPHPAPAPSGPAEKRRLVNSRTGTALTDDEISRIGGLRTLPPKKEDFVPTPMSQLSVGDRIEHDRFGPGVILEITGTIPELKAKISFEKHGMKILLLKYAKIRKLPLV